MKGKVGEMIGGFGRNGAGKSTLLKLIFVTLKADSIVLKINSETISQKNII
ncbi:ABC transporter ATP-binding protein [Tenacibaculum sp. SG-28]|uniref:ATP-binding cassette domain-containing protein n=1 Tax=Tenacibaculum sp. SG-28 TaxID=754426 RepID=UPI002100E501|nr:ATP-binding cassette domain-containing protein [Tenacibaculum sp. SG-28]